MIWHWIWRKTRNVQYKFSQIPDATGALIITILHKFSSAFVVIRRVMWVRMRNTTAAWQVRATRKRAAGNVKAQASHSSRGSLTRMFPCASRSRPRNRWCANSSRYRHRVERPLPPHSLAASQSLHNRWVDFLGSMLIHPCRFICGLC